MNYLKKQELGFYRGVIRLMLPMVVQNFVSASLAMADTFMVGALGETELAAVTMANTPFFILMVFSFGIQSGAGVLVAQYHGKGNLAVINRVMGMGLYVSAAVTITVGLLSFLFPETLMRVLTNNEALVSPGATYARIVGFAFFFASLSGLYSAVHRSMENPRIGALVLSGSGLLNIFLNYILIFGKLGFPQLGVAGAALATLISRAAEVAVLIPYARRSRRLPLIPALILRPGKVIMRDFIRYTLPVVFNEMLWALAFSLYAVIIGHMPDNTPLLAAYTICVNLDRLLSVGLFAFGASVSVIIGREIGLGRQNELYGKGVALNMLGLLFGALTALLTLLLRGLAVRQWIFPLVHLSPDAVGTAMFMLLLLAVSLPLRSLSLTNIVGVFRGGGDVRFAMLVDILPMYLLTVPMAALSGLVLKLGIRAVLLCIFADDLIKTALSLPRLRSKKWINDVTRENI